MIDNAARSLAARALSPLDETTSTVAASTSSVTLVSGKARRGPGIVITNNGYGDLYVRFGSSAASQDNYTTIIEPGTTVNITSDHVGSIQGIWTTTGGSASVTEYT